MRLFIINLLFLCIGVLSYGATHEIKEESTDLVEFKFDWDGYERLYYVHFPPADKMQRPLPLLFNLHGGGGRAKRTPKLTFNRFNDLADEKGFIVIYPQGIERQWNDGRKDKGVTAWREDIDDVGFITEIISRMKSTYNIDEQRIFTTGMSNGGFMSTRLACEKSDIFRGAAIVTAQISDSYYPKCQPSQALGILVMNGTNDPLVPYEGGDIVVLNQNRGSIISTEDYVAFWAKNNNCKNQNPNQNLPNINRRDGSTVTKREYSDCDQGGALQLYTINGGGHTWPGGKQYWTKKMIGTTNKDINACDVIWAFFESLD